MGHAYLGEVRLPPLPTGWEWITAVSNRDTPIGGALDDRLRIIITLELEGRVLYDKFWGDEGRQPITDLEEHVAKQVALHRMGVNP